MYIFTVIEICSPKVRMGWQKTQKKESAGLDLWPTVYLGVLFLSKLSNDPDFFGIAQILINEAYIRYRSSSSSGFQCVKIFEEYIPVLTTGTDRPPNPKKN